MKKLLENVLMSVILFLFLLVYARPLQATEPEFSYTPEVSVPITLMGLSAWAAGEWLKPQLVEGRDTRSWVNPVDDAVRNAFSWSVVHQDDAHILSNIVLGSIPVFASGLLFFADDMGAAAPSVGRAKQTGIGTLILLESASVAMLANQTIKFVVLRNRPYTRADNYGASPTPDDHLSFYSGHTTVAFSLAVAGANLHQMRGGSHPGWVWTVALGLATCVGYLRIAADKHYLSDVLVGAITGMAAGFLIPRYLHPTDEKDSGTQKSTMAVFPVTTSNTWMLGFGFSF